MSEPKSRSKQRRMAMMEGKPMPTFSGDSLVPDKPVSHWRRHDDGMSGLYVVATACGHLRTASETTSDPTKADCPECVSIHHLQPYLKREAAMQLQSPNAPWKRGV